jgi:hypothetical protein
MKNILLENMLRFGTKNLSNEAQQTLSKLAEQAPVPEASAEKYNEYKTQMYYEMWKRICWPSAPDRGVYNTNYIPYQFIVSKKKGNFYPMWQKITPELVAKFKPLNAQSIATFNADFKAEMPKALADSKWLAGVAAAFNKIFGITGATPNDDVKAIQAYVASRIQDKTKVANNGKPGQSFVDGIWGPVSAAAWCQLAQELYNPSMYLQNMANQHGINSANLAVGL